MKRSSALRALRLWQKPLISGAATLALLTGVTRSLGDTLSQWVAAVSGNWTDPTKWDDGEPNNGGSDFDASIAASGTAYTVTLNSNITVDGLTLNSANATVDQTSGTLTLANGGTAALTAGTYDLDGGTISNSIITASGSVLQVSSNSGNMLTGDTITGDIFANTTSAAVQIGGGTTFTTAHLAGSGSSIGFQNNQTLGGGTTVSTISFENGAGSRSVENTAAGSTNAAIAQPME